MIRAAAVPVYRRGALFPFLLALMPYSLGLRGYLQLDNRSDTTITESHGFDSLRVRISANSSKDEKLWEWRGEGDGGAPSVVVLNNSNLVMLAECVAQYPTEWVFNGDITDAGTAGIDDDESTRSRSEYSERDGELYKSFIKLSYCSELNHNETLRCRSVADPPDNNRSCVLLKLTPYFSGHHYLVRITKEVCSGDDDVGLKVPPPPSGCSIEVLVSNFAENYYVHCNFTEQPSNEGWQLDKVEFHSCETAAYCANTMRHARIPANCVKVVSFATSSQNKALAWTEVGVGKPGLVVCTRHSFGDSEPTEQMAVEYFLGRPNHPDPEEEDYELHGPERTLYFSQPGISMSELIWMEPPTTRPYYTVENLQINCFVPLYGFAGYPEFWITFTALDGSYTKERQDPSARSFSLGNRFLDVHLETTWVHPGAWGWGPGSYEIRCLAPVWNTTEWANVTQFVQVRDVEPLRFNEAEVRVVLSEGTEGAQLRCDAYGDPMPVPEHISWSWDPERYPGEPKNGTVLTLPLIAAAQDGTVIKCTARSLLNREVTKSFHVSVTRPLAPGIIAAIVAATLCIGLLGGLVWMYFEYWRYRGIVLPTREDLREFWYGNTSTPSEVVTETLAVPMDGARGYVPLNEVEQRPHDSDPLSIQSLPYNKEWEVARRKIRVDWKSILGSGEFSVVYKGTVAGTPVGVKIVKREKPLDHFKALMSELKIHAHIGHHENVVKLVAANASRIRKRELFVCVELCSGSMLAYLQESQTSGDPTDATLRRWAIEIAAGMEFIASKRIVHGDLAARNVLLTFGPELIAKVGDFGLARLTDYIYTQQNDTPRPWAWMAIECFTERRFSTKSDVWAYGVTLWEMWTLGRKPFETMEFGNEFCQQLVRGMRLEQPALVPGSYYIYEVMNHCWSRNPRDRPTFVELGQRLQQQQL